MENLTVKELQSLCKGFGLSKTGHKCELIDRIVEHLSHSNSTEINSEDVSCQNQTLTSQINGNQFTIIHKFKQRFIDPLYVNMNSINHNSLFGMIKNISYQFAMLLGVFGGIHSVMQLIMFYFGHPREMQIQMKHFW